MQTVARIMNVLPFPPVWAGRFSIKGKSRGLDVDRRRRWAWRFVRRENSKNRCSRTLWMGMQSALPACVPSVSAWFKMAVHFLNSVFMAPFFNGTPFLNDLTRFNGPAVRPPIFEFGRPPFSKFLWPRGRALSNFKIVNIHVGGRAGLFWGETLIWNVGGKCYGPIKAIFFAR